MNIDIFLKVWQCCVPSSAKSMKKAQFSNAMSKSSGREWINCFFKETIYNRLRAQDRMTIQMSLLYVYTETDAWITIIINWYIIINISIIKVMGMNVGYFFKGFACPFLWNKCFFQCWLVLDAFIWRTHLASFLVQCLYISMIVSSSNTTSPFASSSNIIV